jgi:ketosteroid isomerase-like protein
MMTLGIRHALMLLSVLPLRALALDPVSRDEPAFHEVFDRTVDYYAAWSYTREDTRYDEAGVFYSQQPDLVFWDPLPPLGGHRGWAEYRQVIDGVWKPAGMVAAGILLARDGSFAVWRHGDVILTTANCIVHAEFVAALPATTPCRGTQLWQREQNDWRVVHEHFSSPMSPHAALYLAERTVDDRLRVSAAFLARARSVAAAWGAGPLADAALRLRPFYSEQALTRLYLPWLPHDGHPGWAEFAAGLKEYAGRAVRKLSLRHHEDLEASVRGDLAWTTATLELTFELPDGRVNRASARQTLVWVLERDEWRIAHEHLSIPAVVSAEARP